MLPAVEYESGEPTVKFRKSETFRSGNQNSCASLIAKRAPSRCARIDARSGRHSAARASSAASSAGEGGTPSVSSGSTGLPVGRASRRLSVA